MHNYPKQILSIPQQIKSYYDAGMIIESIEEVEEALSKIGYYRLRGYSFHLYNNETKKYNSGTKFSDILGIYYFDRELSDIVFSMILKIEVALRARLVDALLVHEDALILQDSSVFYDKEKYWKNMSSIASEIARSNDVFIKHNLANHDGEVPVWAAAEVLSFGTLSKVIKNLKAGKDNSYAKLAEHYTYISQKGKIVKPSKDMFTSWVQAVSVLRNICAHNSRIYNRTIHTAPELINSEKTTPQPKNNGLYQIILAMKYLRPSNREWNDFADKLETLIEKNRGAITLEAINFPETWKNNIRV